MEDKIRDIESEIAGYKQLLANSDYQALKYAEGFIGEDDYAEIRERRQALRDKINDCEAQEIKLMAESKESEA